MYAAFISAAQQLQIRELAVPEPGATQIRIRVDYVGICGSDLHYYFHGANGEYAITEPLIPGHELSGVVDADPFGEWEQGTRVTVHPARFGPCEAGLEGQGHLWSGGTYLGSAATTPHTQGAMSQYMLVERGMLRALPAELDIRTAVLAEPLAVALHALNRAPDIRGKQVLVSGAGPIGLLSAIAARASGAEVTVADLRPEALTRAAELPQELRPRHSIQIGAESLPVQAYDVIFECSGAPAAISAAISAVRRRGSIIQVGMLPHEALPVNLAPLISKEAQLVGSFRFLDEIEAAIQLLAQYPGIASIITQEYPLDQLTQALETARDAQASAKVVICMQDAS